MSAAETPSEPAPGRAGEGAAAAADVEAWLAATGRWTEEHLEAWLRGEGLRGEARIGGLARGTPARLVEVLRHALLGGGKRLRPALVRLFAVELGGDDRGAAPPAVAIELVHTYSLVHDDLPCMDDDDLRRGRPTCHKVFGEALAVLAGDALQAAAFEVLAAADGALGAGAARAMTAVLAAAAGPAGMVGGQVLDMEWTGAAPDVERVRAVHELKTARLLSAAAELGALAAGADGAVRARAAAFGRALGLAFQAVDDVLDVTGDAATLGKTPGKDAALQKPSLVGVLGLDGTRAEAERRGAEARALAGELGFGRESLPLALVDRLLARRR